MYGNQDDVVSKPFRIPELMPKIRDVIAKFQVKSEHG